MARRNSSQKYPPPRVTLFIDHRPMAKIVSMWKAYTFIDEETYIGGLAWNAYTFIDEETFIRGLDPGMWVRISKFRDC